jgi:flagellar protein FlgJ
MRVDLGASTQAMPEDTQRHAKLADAAQQFEATMLQELLKPMQHGGSSLTGEEESDDSASDTISSYGSESLAKAISQGGGFGIARQIITKVTLEGHKNPENRAPEANGLPLRGR